MDSSDGALGRKRERSAETAAPEAKRKRHKPLTAQSGLLVDMSTLPPPSKIESKHLFFPENAAEDDAVLLITAYDCDLAVPDSFEVVQRLGERKVAMKAPRAEVEKWKQNRNSSIAYKELRGRPKGKPLSIPPTIFSFASPVG